MGKFDEVGKTVANMKGVLLLECCNMDTQQRKKEEISLENNYEKTRKATPEMNRFETMILIDVVLDLTWS